MCRTAFILRFTVIHGGKKLDLITHFMGGNGMRERCRRLNVHIRRFGHHAPEKRNIQGIQGIVNHLFGDFDQLFVFQAGGVKIFSLRISGKCGGLSLAEKQQGIIGEKSGHRFTASGGLFFARSQCATGVGQQ